MTDAVQVLEGKFHIQPDALDVAAGSEPTWV